MLETQTASIYIIYFHYFVLTTLTKFAAGHGKVARKNRPLLDALSPGRGGFIDGVDPVLDRLQDGCIRLLDHLGHRGRLAAHAAAPLDSGRR